MRVAIVVDWLTDCGGAESVFAEALKVFPGAKLHALVDQMSDADHKRLGIPRAHTSWLQAMVGVTGNYRKMLPLMPTALRSLNLEDVDVVLAISHAVAQQAPVLAGQKLLVLSLSPMRYAWDLREQYLAESGLESGIASLAIRFMLDRLQDGDRESSKRVDAYAAISHHIADRVKRAYNRESELIYPPVDTQFFTPGKSSRAPEGAYYVTASRFVPYKRVDLLVRAFVATPERRLVVIGDGPDALKVRAAASGAKNVTFVGHAGREELRDWLRGAKAFVFAAEEDFGIAPVEAQACGVPVIAYGKGGALETIIADVSGRFFNEQTVESIHEAVARFESAPGNFTPQACRASAERFAAAKFREALGAWVERQVERLKG